MENGVLERKTARRDISGVNSLHWHVSQVPELPLYNDPGHPQADSRTTTMTHRIKGWWRTYLSWSPLPMRTVLVAAGLLAVLFVFTSFIGRTQLGTAMEQFDWWQQAPGPFLNFFTWAFLLPLVNRWSQRWSLKSHPVSKAIVTHIGLGLLLCSAHEVITNVLYLVLLIAGGKIHLTSDTLHGMLLFLPAGVVQRFLEYWVVLLILLYMETRRQVQEERNHVLRLQNELQTTQLLALKKQLQPHFLFNTLNTVSALMDVDRKSARTVLARLGSLLRTTLDEERRETVPLYHEIDHIANYLGIESIRFKDRLRVEYRIPEECGDAMVPGMVLQPLVENSIKHGLDNSTDEMCITITAKREKDTLHLTVRDDGKGCPDTDRALRMGGIGLRNIRERLLLLHGRHAHFHVASGPEGGFLAAISIPFVAMDINDHEEHPNYRGG